MHDINSNTFKTTLTKPIITVYSRASDHNYNDQVKVDKMAWACSMHGRGVLIGLWWESQKERDH
jgi:hypothetical protein